MKKNNNLSAAEFKRRKAQQQNPGKRPWWDKPAPGLDPVVAREYNVKIERERRLDDVQINSNVERSRLYDVFRSTGNLYYQLPEQPRRSSRRSWTYDIYQASVMERYLHEHLTENIHPYFSTRETPQEKKKREFTNAQMEIVGREYYMQHLYREGDENL